MSIDAMKQALELLESAHVATDLVWKRYDCITALRAAIEQAQEPMAWMYHGIRHDDTPHERPSLIWKPEYMDVMSAEKGAKATPLYTAPRQWQGLTDEFLEAIAEKHVTNCYFDTLAFARAIEAKLKEKNT